MSSWLLAQKRADCQSVRSLNSRGTDVGGLVWLSRRSLNRGGRQRGSSLNDSWTSCRTRDLMSLATRLPSEEHPETRQSLILIPVRSA